MDPNVSLGFVFAIFFVTLGPLKLIPPFFFATQGLDAKTQRGLALKSTLLSALILVVTVALAIGLLTNWRVSRETLTVTGGLLLLFGSLRSLAHGVAAPHRPDPDQPRPAPASLVISPLTIPATITPWGLVALMLFAGIAQDQHRLAGVGLVLLLILVMNFVCMLVAAPVMRFVGMPAMSVLGWVFSILQASLGVTFLLHGLTAVLGLAWTPTPI